MVVEKRNGPRVEDLLHLLLAMPRKALRARGHMVGIDYRRWAGDNEGAAIATRVIVG